MSKAIKVFSILLAIFLAAPLFSQEVNTVMPHWEGEQSSHASVAYDSVNNRFLRVFLACKNFSDADMECIVGRDYTFYGTIIDHDRTIISPIFPISQLKGCTSLNRFRLGCAVAFDHINQRYLVVWPDYRNGIGEIYGQFIDVDGQLIGASGPDGGNFRISNCAKNPITCDLEFDAVAQRFLVVWESEFDYNKCPKGNIQGRFVNSKQLMNPLDNSQEFVFAPSEGGQIRPSIAFDQINRNYLLVWSDFYPTTDTAYVKAMLVDKDGKSLMDKRDLIISGPYKLYLTPGHQVVEWENRTNRFLVLWTKPGIELDLPGDSYIYGRIVNCNGTLRGIPGSKGDILLDFSEYLEPGEDVNCVFPNVAFDSAKGDFGVIFNERRFVYGCRIAPNGKMTKKVFRLGGKYNNETIFCDNNCLAYNSRCGYFMTAIKNMFDTDIPEFWFWGDSICLGLAQVRTGSVENVLAENAACKGKVIMDGGLDVTARGMCWSTEPGPDLSGSHTTDGKGMGYFRSVLTGLLPNTKYYVRAYATNSAGTVFGGERTFTTQPAFVVSFKAQAGGILEGDTTQHMLEGQSCSPVKAMASKGYFFVAWNGDGGFGSSLENPLVVRNVKGNMNIMAGFNPITLQGERIAARDRALKNDIGEIDISCNSFDASLPLVFKLYRSIDGVGRQLVGQFSSADLADGHHHVLAEGLVGGTRYEFMVEVLNQRGENVGESRGFTL